MKFYHYAAKGNSVMRDGLCAFATSPNGDLAHYMSRSNAPDKVGVIRWMEDFFTGYSRGVRCFSEPIKYYPHSQRLKELVDSCDLFEIDADQLSADGLLEQIYINPALSMDDTVRAEQCRKMDTLHNDGFYPIKMIDIPTDPVDWTVCDDKTGRRFAFVPFYFLIITTGIIPPKYLRKV